MRLRHGDAVAMLLTGTLLLGSVTACGSSDSTGPANPPPLTGLAVVFSQPHATQSEVVGFTVTLPPAGVPAGATLVLRLSFNGTSGAADSSTVPAHATGLQGTVTVPAGLPDGTLILSADLPAQRDSAHATLVVKDTVPPALNGVAFLAASAPHLIWAPAPTNGPFLTTTSSNDSLVVGGIDNDDVAWVGFALGAPANVRDSIATQGTIVSWRTPLPLASPALVGTSPELSVFTIDEDGNRTDFTIGAVMIGQYVDRPVISAPLDASVPTIAYDAKRQLIYLPQPKLSSIAVVSLASLTVQASIPVPAPPIDLDLTPSGDTLVVALGGTGDLAFVDLNHRTTVGTVHLNTLNATPGDTSTLLYQVDGVRVAADGRILVPIRYTLQNGVPFGLAQFNPVSGTDSIVVTGPYIYSNVRGGKSVDGTKVLLTNASTTSDALIYSATAHAYAAGVARTDQLQGPASADQTGAHFLIGQGLFDGGMNALGGVGPYFYSGAPEFGSVISASGSDAYVSDVGACGSDTCATTGPSFYLRFHVPMPAGGLGGQLMEAVDAPDRIRGMWATPDGHWLIAFGVSTIMRFDLTQSSPAAAHPVAPPIRARRDTTTTPRRAPGRSAPTIVTHWITHAQ